MPMICNMEDVVVTDAAEILQCPSAFSACHMLRRGVVVVVGAAPPGCSTPCRNSSPRLLPWHFFAASVLVVRTGRIAVGDVSEEDKMESAWVHQARGNCRRHLILH
ncbi:hypothetical protein ACQJBY_004192 [Aegilops geniculata]